jgi:hypothetical protein
LGTDCAHRLKKKRPDMSLVLDYYHQCRTRDRIRRLSMESAAPSTSPQNADLKTPLELQLWYDMVRTDGNRPPDSTVCPTIGSTALDVSENTVTISVPSNAYGLLQDPCPEDSSSAPHGDGDDDVSPIIPLITELGVNSDSVASFHSDLSFTDS